MKHFHMLMVFLTIVLFIYQSFIILTKGQMLSKKAKIATHVLYTLLIVSGAMMVMPLLSLNVPLQWVFAKIILLIAAVSASIKAFRPTTTLPQRKVGIFIASVAYAGILALAFIKPDNLL